MLIDEIEFWENNFIENDFIFLKGKKWVFENIRKEKLRVNMIRFKVRWLEEGNKLINYFCYFEFWKFLNNIIKKVEIFKKGVIFNCLIFFKEVVNFYKILCKNLDFVFYDVDFISFIYLYNILKVEIDIVLVFDKDIEEGVGGGVICFKDYEKY